MPEAEFRGSSSGETSKKKMEIQGKSKWFQESQQSISKQFHTVIVTGQEDHKKEREPETLEQRVKWTRIGPIIFNIVLPHRGASGS